MPIQKLEFGSIVGNVADDCRFVVAGSGAKNALAITCSYESAVIGVGGGITHPAFDDPTFYGRILVCEGDSLAAVPVDIDTYIPQKTYLDLALHTTGPFTFLFPLQSLQGNVQTSLGGVLVVVLARAFTKNNTETFRGRISIAGQTILP